MKVGISTTTLEPSRNRGIVDGIGHYTDQLMRYLAEGGHEVAPYAFRPLRGKGESFRFSQSFDYSFPVSMALAMATGGRWPKARPEVDLFHFTDFKVIPVSVPSVATIWDAIPLTQPQWLSVRGRLFAPRVLKSASRFADRVIAVSEHAANEINTHFNIPADRIRVVPWAADDMWMERRDGAHCGRVLSSLGLQPGFFLSVGTLQPRKNFQMLVNAYLKLPAAVREERPLVIVGRHGWGCEDLVSYLSQRSRSDHIIWLNNIDSDRDLRALYQAAGVFVFPSLYEGFGVPVLEAFASRVPVIASNATSIPEVAGDAAILLPPDSERQFSEAMMALASDERKRVQLVDSGLEQLSRFSWNRTLQQTLDVYRELA